MRAGPVAPSQSSSGVFSPLDGGVRLSGGVLGARQDSNASAGLLHGWRMLRASGVAGNFELVASGGSAYKGTTYSDSDFYKWLEGAMWQAERGLAGEVSSAVESAVRLVERAQLADGYVNTYVQHFSPGRRWAPDNPHEFYNLSHLVQAGVAGERSAGDERLLEIAVRAADQAERTVTGDANIWNLGHPGIEMALVELYRTTGDARYLRFARKILGFRGERKELLIGSGLSEWEDVLLPDPWDPELRGHAVCALYLMAGMTDLFAELGEDRVGRAVDAKWHDLVERKAYITGNAGSRHAGEAFGYAYELPSGRAYCETCAGVAIAMWSWRMLLLHGDGAYADWFERVLYNAVLAGVSPEGTRFFYANPLESRREIERAPWYRCPCCPTNVMRFLAQVDQYVATRDGSGVQLHQFAPGDVTTSLAGAGKVHLSVRTRYPVEATVSVAVTEPGSGPWQLSLRSPSWCSEEPSVSLNGAPLHDGGEGRPGYICMDRRWQSGDVVELRFPLRAGFTEADRRVWALRGMVAVMRGPLVYCAEDVDQPWPLEPSTASVLTGATIREEPRTDLDGPLGEYVALLAGSRVAQERAMPLYRAAASNRAGGGKGGAETPELVHERAPDLVLVPYYLWANRGRSEMRVWLDRAD
jgi:uncharacterized protein